MRLHHRAFVPVVVAAALVLCLPRRVMACDFGHRSVDQLFRDATDVFIGRVAASPFIRDDQGTIILDPGVAASAAVTMPLRFAVITRYKGANAGDVLAEGGRSTCGINFAVGDIYVIFGARSDGRLSTGASWGVVRLSPPDESSRGQAEAVLTYLESRRP